MTRVDSCTSAGWQAGVHLRDQRAFDSGAVFSFWLTSSLFTEVESRIALASALNSEEYNAMKLTPFGEAVRSLRMRLDLSMKSMADFMGISSSHLSGIEYGEKRLAAKHIDRTVAFFAGKASADEIAKLRSAAEQSKDIVDTSKLNADARGLVAAFARRLQEGDTPTSEIRSWITKRKEPSK
jgi:transcriptional regulator with XRE-family HTH domain